MPQDPPRTPPREQETSVDVFEHEVEELERSYWQENKLHILLVVGCAVAIALSLGAAFFILGSVSRPSAGGASTIMTIDTIEPRGGRLSARPTHYSWESIGRTKKYLLTISEQGSDNPLIARETTSTSLDLNTDEAARLVMGGSYSWRVAARSNEGWTIGEGGGAFSLY